MDWNVACRLATVYKKQIEDFNPKYIMEMQGIADGAGRRFEEILAINCRSELRAMSGYVPAECTTVAFSRQQVRMGIHILAKLGQPDLAARVYGRVKDSPGE